MVSTATRLRATRADLMGTKVQRLVRRWAVGVELLA
jgi:hypothetical protein